MQIVKKYEDIEKLTIEILHEFIDKIVVHHKEIIYGETKRQVESYYKMIGNVQIPKFTKTEKQRYLNYFGIKKEQIA